MARPNAEQYPHGKKGVVSHMGNWSVIQHRNFNDFKYGSFTVYVTKKEIVIRGILKRDSASSLYIQGRKK